VSQQTSNRYFDDLARAVAEGSLSRGRVLKLFAGTALAVLIPSRALADEDCVRVCHVPFDRETEECDPANAVTRCVSRRERRRHLEKHPCDCQGRCANCLTPPAEPICDPPCTEGQECMEGPTGEQPICQPICTPSCPDPCSCFVSGEPGGGNVCVSGLNARLVNSCDECPPAGFPEDTSCIDLSPSPDLVLLACAQPCPQQP
jgi:hypothetical protein